MVRSANQLWKESNTSLTFKDWIDREKQKGMFIPNKKYIQLYVFTCLNVRVLLSYLYFILFLFR